VVIKLAGTTMNNTDIITVKAKLKLKTTDEGGRQSGIQTGYRPNHVFEYSNKDNLMITCIGEITFSKERIQPGDEEIVTVTFMRDQPIDRYMNAGQKWWIHEGRRLVGEAELLEV
jgi:translation elongation factor EF-Tu-like GTPase